MKYFYSAIVLLLIASCGNDKKPLDHSKTDWAFYKLNGNVKSVIEKSFAKDTLGKLVPKQENFSDYDTEFHFNENGQLVLEKKLTADGKLFSETKFKGRDYKTEYTQYVSGSPSVRTTFQWDKSKKYNTVITRNNADNTPIDRTETRLKAGLPVEKIIYNAQNHPIDKVVYGYDQKGNLRAENFYFNKEYIQLRNLYEYDAKNRKISETRTDSDGKMLSKTVYEYEGDKISSQINYNEKNEVDSYEKFSYDNKGNIIAHISFSKLDGETRDEYTYDNKNNKTSWNYMRGGKSEMKVKYAYDTRNMLTSYKATGSEGTVTESKSYKTEYDKKGNWIKKTTIINNKPAYILERIINYYK